MRMMKRLPVIKATLLVIALVLCLSCRAGARGTARLWTNRPEIAAYTETYNAENPQYRIMLHYVPDPAVSLREADSDDRPDLIIAGGLTNEALLPLFSSLQPFITEGRLDTAPFYQKLLSPGRHEGAQALLPFSFDLALIYFNPNIVTIPADKKHLTVDDLKELTSRFRQVHPESPGFSPRWSGEFLYYLSLARGSDFGDDGAGFPAWNEGALEKALTEVRQWETELCGGQELLDDFNQKHLHNPGYKLVNDGEIAFFYTTIRDYHAIPAAEREKLDFRWLALPGGIPVSDDILYAGLPRKNRRGLPFLPARNRAAGDFLLWLFQAETEKKLLASSRYKRIRSFGLADGFAALPRINGETLTASHSYLPGRIPDAGEIQPPPSHPAEWLRMKPAVLYPWLQAASGREGTARDLREELQNWQLKQLSAEP